MFLPVSLLCLPTGVFEELPGLFEVRKGIFHLIGIIVGEITIETFIVPISDVMPDGFKSGLEPFQFAVPPGNFIYFGYRARLWATLLHTGVEYTCDVLSLNVYSRN